MSMVVETGAGLSNSESYATVAQADAYASAFGLAWVGSETVKEVALRRGAAFLDATYAARFVGQRRFGRLQALEWPRAFAITNSRMPELIAAGIVPIEVIRSSVVAAAAALASPDALSVNTSSSGSGSFGEIKREKAADHEIEYFQSRTDDEGAAGASQRATLGDVIEGLLGGLLVSKAGRATFLLRA